MCVCVCEREGFLGLHSTLRLTQSAQLGLSFQTSKQQHQMLVAVGQEPPARLVTLREHIAPPRALASPVWLRGKLEHHDP